MDGRFVAVCPFFIAALGQGVDAHDGGEPGDGEPVERIATGAEPGAARAAPKTSPGAAAEFALVLDAAALSPAHGFQQLPVQSVGTNMVAGGAAADFNNDGWPDLFALSGGAVPDALYVNQGDGTFVDEAAAWGVVRAHMGGGVCAGDFDRDGWIDLFVTSLALPDDDQNLTGSFFLYRNNGDGTFTDVANAAGLTFPYAAPNGMSASFADYDLDGWLDLFVPFWNTDDGPSSLLYRNRGDGTFVDATEALDGGLSDVWAFTPHFVDVNGDVFPDLLLAGDFGTSAVLLNDRDGSFTRLSRSASGVDADANAMGADIADFNADGRPDWFLTEIHQSGSSERRGNTLYLNQGGGLFAAVKGGDLADGGWGWGARVEDFDHDGDLDVMHVNGWPSRPDEANRFFRQNNEGLFQESGAAVGFDDHGQGRGLVTLDLDRDGDLDSVVFNLNGPTLCYRNELDGADRNWLVLSLNEDLTEGVAPHGIGAVVTAEVGAKMMRRFVGTGPSYLSTSEPIVHLGLGAAMQVDQLRIDWPNGTTTCLANVAANQGLSISPEAIGDVDIDGGVDIDDLYAAYRLGPPDMDCDGDSDAEDIRLLVRRIRLRERIDMLGGVPPQRR